MNLKAIIILFLLIGAISSCDNTPKEWQELEYVEELKCDSLYSGTINYPVIKCRSYFDNDTLIVHLSDMSWQFITVKIYNGKFRAKLSGVPFHMVVEEELLFKTRGQQLQVGKTNYATNDTLCARFDFLFQQIGAKTNHVEDWHFNGFICEIIRDKNFDPFDPAHFMNFDLPTAIHEIGEPLCQNTISTQDIGEFQIELWNYLDINKPIWIEELTWDSSTTREISSEGRERLTIWYIEKNAKWLPIHYKIWNEDWQF